MKTSTFLLLVGAVVAVYLIRQSGQTKPAAQAATDGGAGEASPIVPVVEKTLAQHAGEDSPIVHAFEEAVAHEHSKG